MTNKLFDVTKEQPAKAVIVHADSAPRAGSLFAVTTPGKDVPILTIDVETRNQHGLGVEDFITDRQLSNEKIENSGFSGVKTDLSKIAAIPNETLESSMEELIRRSVSHKDHKSLLIADPTSLRRLGKTNLVNEVIQEEVKMLVTDSMSQLVDEARTIDAIPNTKHFLTMKKCKVGFELENTKIGPSNLTLLCGKKFKEAYERQLLVIIFGGEDVKNVEELISLTRVFSAYRNTPNGVQVSSRRFKRRLPEIIQVINSVFKEHEYVLSSTVDMLSNPTKPKDPVATDMEVYNPDMMPKHITEMTTEKLFEND